MKTIIINEIKLEVPDSEVEELVKKYAKRESSIDYLTIGKNTPIFEMRGDDVYEHIYNDSRLLAETESTSKEQLESIIKLNVLANIARVLNDGWVPDFKTSREYNCGFTVLLNSNIEISNFDTIHFGGVFFKSKQLAQKAIDLLGEEFIKKALTLNYK
jgi:hypothetical protein